jgi:plastocyanin
MKKLYSSIIALALVLVSMNANAVTITVLVGSGGNNFSPQAFSATVGDVIHFEWASGFHDVTQNSAPAGAAAITSPGTLDSSGDFFDYTVTVAGTYTYYCSIHGIASMNGGFNATAATSITEPNVDLTTHAYPNPFMDKITFKYNGISSIEILNVLGAQVKTIQMPTLEGKMDVDFEGLPAGAYFFRTYKDGVIQETRKIVKSK